MLWRRRASGFVLITMIASMVVILSIVGLAIDTGHLATCESPDANGGGRCRDWRRAKS